MPAVTAAIRMAQARLAAKTQRLAAAEERMVGAFYATAEEKRRAWCEGG